MSTAIIRPLRHRGRTELSTAHAIMAFYGPFVTDDANFRAFRAAAAGLHLIPFNRSCGAEQALSSLGGCRFHSNRSRARA